MSELRKQTKDDVVYFASPQLQVYPRLRHAFFTRVGGVSQGAYESLNFRRSSQDTPENVRENFRIAAGVLGFTFLFFQAKAATRRGQRFEMELPSVNNRQSHAAHEAERRYKRERIQDENE